MIKVIIHIRLIILLILLYKLKWHLTIVFNYNV